MLLLRLLAFVLGAQLASVLAANKISNEYFNQNIPDEETSLTEDDFRRSIINQFRRLRRGIDVSVTFSPIVNDSAMYNRNRFEGDIIHPGSYTHNFLEDGEHATGSNLLLRNAVRQPFLKWPNKRIPYTISTQYTSAGKEKIAEAITDYRQKTCLQLVPKEASDTDYLHIMPEDGCYSLVGKVGGKQPVSLGDGCLQKGIIIHELMHAAGFFHEQSRNDRDSYVTIKWENVEPGLQDQFDKYSLAIIDDLGTKYDYGSVMHYGATAFSKNGRPTIVPNQAGAQIGQRQGFSVIDLLKVNKLYDCPAVVDPPSPASGQSGQASAGPLTVTCVDQRFDCAYLTAQGFCDNPLSAPFMDVGCAKSCGNCHSAAGGGSGGGNAIGTSGSPCVDHRPWCPNWALAQMCKMYLFSAYMQQKCPKSCGLCSR